MNNVTIYTAFQERFAVEFGGHVKLCIVYAVNCKTMRIPAMALYLILLSASAISSASYLK